MAGMESLIKDGYTEAGYHVPRVVDGTKSGIAILSGLVRIQNWEAGEDWRDWSLSLRSSAVNDETEILIRYGHWGLYDILETLPLCQVLYFYPTSHQVPSRITCEWSLGQPSGFHPICGQQTSKTHMLQPNMICIVRVLECFRAPEAIVTLYKAFQTTWPTFRAWISGYLSHKGLSHFTACSW